MQNLYENKISALNESNKQYFENYKKQKEK